MLKGYKKWLNLVVNYGQHLVLTQFFNYDKNQIFDGAFVSLFIRDNSIEAL